MVADDLDGVLVGADSTVRTEAEELALVGASLCQGDLLLLGQRLEGDVVHDADGEIGLGLLALEVLEH